MENWHTFERFKMRIGNIISSYTLENYFHIVSIKIKDKFLELSL